MKRLTIAAKANPASTSHWGANVRTWRTENELGEAGALVMLGKTVERCAKVEVAFTFQNESDHDEDYGDWV
jgi:hypothetical protein